MIYYIIYNGAVVKAFTVLTQRSICTSRDVVVYAFTDAVLNACTVAVVNSLTGSEVYMHSLSNHFKFLIGSESQTGAGRTL